MILELEIAIYPSQISSNIFHGLDHKTSKINAAKDMDLCNPTSNVQFSTQQDDGKTSRVQKNSMKPEENVFDVMSAVLGKRRQHKTRTKMLMRSTFQNITTWRFIGF